uniref:B1292H11.15 protein n=1 Tax=Oryza sativa subsp. japonica TaxID=39947 RepID=Q6MWB6_ORYSJ|nr:B1292H11.15 [Oryza sativa Japonica Group]
MADRDEEQILYDTIAEGSSQYWNEEVGNEDPNQYLNDPGNVERDVEGNDEGNEEEEASGSHPSAGQKRAHGQRGAAKNIEGRHIITKGLTPNFDVFPKLRDHWDEFAAYKTGQQGQAMMVRNKENAAKKKYHHHLGSGGCSVAMPNCEEMEASLIERGIEQATVDGSLVFSDQIREAASRLTEAVEASTQGTFRPDREKDELSLALQTPEHPGRTRGKGMVHWKIGFKEDIHTYRSRMRSKRDTEAKIVDLEYRVSSYELSIQEEVARKVASEMAIPTDPSGTYHCRPIPVGYSRVEVELVEAAYEDLELDYPGGDGETHLHDTSHAIILWRKRYIILPRRKAASHAPSPPAPPLSPPHQSPPPSPPQDPAPTPPQALAPTPPQATAPRPPAPSKSRTHQAPPPARTRATKKAKVDAAENKEPPYYCMQQELDAYVAAEVKRQLKPRSPEKKIPIDPGAKKFFRSMSAPAKEAIKLTDYERTLKKAYYGKYKQVHQLGEQSNQEVEPLVTGQEIGIKEFLSNTGLTRDQLLKGAPIPKMYKFHQRYMEMSTSGREIIGARIKSSDFLQGEDVLWINFKDIYELYQLDALDVFILSAWILMEIQRARWRGVFDTGFIDPRKVNIDMITDYPQAIEDNLVNLLKEQHYKRFHWVLLLFDLEAYRVNFYDSMNKDESTFDQVFELIDRAWYRFRHLVRGNWKEKLRRRFKFPVIHMRDNLTHKEFIAAVQEQLIGFINEQVLYPEGEFYYDGNTIHKPLASEITTTTSKS